MAWPLHEGSGTAPYEVGPYGISGAFAAATSTNWKGSGFGAAVLTNGTSEYIDLFSDLLNAQTKGSMIVMAELTAKPAGAAAGDLFGVGSATVANSIWQFQLFGNTASDTRLRMGTNQPGSAVWMGSTSLNIKQPYVFGVTASGSAWKLYVDGNVETGAGTNRGDWFSSQSSGVMRYTLGVCRRSSGNIAFLNGKSAGVLIWNRVLSDEEMREISADPWAVLRPKRTILASSATATTYVPQMMTMGVG